MKAWCPGCQAEREVSEPDARGLVECPYCAGALYRPVEEEGRRKLDPVPSALCPEDGAPVALTPEVKEGEQFLCPRCGKTYRLRREFGAYSLI